MTSESRTIEDDLSVRIVLQRLCLAGAKVGLSFRSKRGACMLMAQEPDRVLAAMGAEDQVAWGLEPGEKVSMTFEDRGFKYETVVTYRGPADCEGEDCAALTVPRILRRADDFRLASFSPDVAPKVTFTNGRNALVDGQVKGMGRDGFEMTMLESGRDIQEVLRMGEESTLDVALEEDLRITTRARVAYYGEDYVGMRFTDRVDGAVLGRYRSWLEEQQRIQAQRDRESFESGGGRPAPRESGAPVLPQVRVWMERDPAILFLTESEEFARHMAEALGRKFGILSLDYIKGRLQPFLQADGNGWGRTRLIVIHHHLRLVSPLELARQLVRDEHCPLPILLAGTDEDLDLKRNRAMAAGAVDYLAVEPFRILTVLRRLDETIKLFE